MLHGKIETVCLLSYAILMPYWSKPLIKNKKRMCFGNDEIMEISKILISLVKDVFTSD